MSHFQRGCARTIVFLSLVVIGTGVARADDDPRDFRILKKLGEPTHVDFTNVPLKDAADYLSDLHQISIYRDIEAFEKAGVSHKTLQITLMRSDVQLWRALGDILRPHKLSFMIKDHTLTITTIDAAKEWQKKNIESDK
jgi:hypothetical protein